MAETYASSVQALVNGTVQTVPIRDTSKAPAIVETATGETINITDSTNAPFQGLQIFGKSTQDGMPSTTSPVPIVIAGSGGSITVNITDGGSQSQSLVISTPDGLPGVPVSSGGNYTDGSGQQYLSNVIDYNEEKMYQYVKELVFNGSESWYVSSTGAFRCDVSGISYATAENQSTLKGAISNKYDSKTWVQMDASKQDGIALGYGIGGIAVRDNSINSLSEFKNSLAENNLQVIAMLETAIISDISSEEILDYKSLDTNYTNTNLFSDSEPPVGIEMDYTADTKIYVDNKVNEAVQQAITVAMA